MTYLILLTITAVVVSISCQYQPYLGSQDAVTATNYGIDNGQERQENIYARDNLNGQYVNKYSRGQGGLQVEGNHLSQDALRQREAYDYQQPRQFEPQQQRAFPLRTPNQPEKPIYEPSSEYDADNEVATIGQYLNYLEEQQNEYLESQVPVYTGLSDPNQKPVPQTRFQGYNSPGRFPAPAKAQPDVHVQFVSPNYGNYKYEYSV